MAEKNEDDNPYSFHKYNHNDKEESDDVENPVSTSLALDLGNGNTRNIETGEPSTSTSINDSTSRKEENPFSFKHFLNQNTKVSNKNKGARPKVYSPSNNSTNDSIQNCHDSEINSDFSSRLLGGSEMSSVLPDFVQDHLVIEQCYLSNSGSSNIDSLNLENIPVLNLEHSDHMPDFTINADIRKERNSVDSSLQNLPDFALSAGQHHSYSSDSKLLCGNSTDCLPDFAINTNGKSRTLLNSNAPKHASDKLPDFTVNTSQMNRTYLQRNESVPSSSHVNRQRIHISSSPSVPLDLPLYDRPESIESIHSANQPIPFDLPLLTEQNDSSNNTRGLPTNDSVSKSLPDFLSDGPIRKERLEDNSQGNRDNLMQTSDSSHYCEHNGLPGPEISPPRNDIERLQRDVETLRRQLSEKCRRIELLESEIQSIRSRERREAVTLENALQQVEDNLQQTVKRAMTAENAVIKLKQENKILKSEVQSLRADNSDLRLGVNPSPSNAQQHIRNRRLAQELRGAANTAESSLRSLLSGVENLRVIAATVENMHKFHDRTDDFQDFNYKDSASGPAL